jgi:hypothetical protein
MSFTIDKRNVDRFARQLAERLPEAAKKATATALNRTAKGAELLAKKAVKANMTTRNKWTIKSIRSTKTPITRPIKRQFVLVGSKAEYMAVQEFGGTLERKGANRRITTSEGAREGKTAYPRKKLARGRLKNRNIRLKRRGGKTGSKGRRAKRAVESARSKGDKFVYLDLGGDRKGIFSIKKRRDSEIVMVHRFMRRKMRVKANRWLKPAVDKSRRIAPKVFKKELEKLRLA